MIDFQPSQDAHTEAATNTIVVPVGSATASTYPCEEAALRSAARLARLSQSRVVLVRVAAVPEDWHLWEPHASKAAVATRSQQERQEGRLVDAAQAIYYSGLAVEVEVVRRVDVPAGIAEAATEVDARLVVMGAPCLKKGLAAHAPACKVTEVVARRTSDVIAVHRATAPTQGKLSPLQRIVLVTPLTASSPFGTRLAGALANAEDARLDIVVVEDNAEGIDRTEVLAALRSQVQPHPEDDVVGRHTLPSSVMMAEGMAEGFRLASETDPDMVVVAGAYPFDALIQANVAAHAAKGGDWLFVFPRVTEPNS